MDEINSSSEKGSKNISKNDSNNDSKMNNYDKDENINSNNEEEEIINYYSYIDECFSIIEKKRQNYLNSLE